MDYQKLLEKKEYMRKNFHLIPKEALENYEAAFAVEYTHDSTTIEGNTLSLVEVGIIIGDKMSVAGKDMREIYEVVNHNKAYEYIKQVISEGKPLDESIVKDVHAILTENIFWGGVYRDTPAYIKGAVHVPPPPQTMYMQVKAFYQDLQKAVDNYVSLAAWTHAEFVKIHPFIDGNGRVSRMIMNYQLMAGGFLPISIPNKRRKEYFDALDKYAAEGDLAAFEDIAAELEEKRLDWYIEAIECVKNNGGADI